MSATRDVSFEELERFERYHSGNMPHDDAEVFIRQLETDADLYQRYHNFIDALDVVSLASFKSQLEAAAQRRPEKPRIAYLKYLWLAAAAVLLTVFAFWFSRPVSLYNELFATYATVEPGLPVPMGAGGEAYTDHFFEAMVDFKDDDFDAAAAKWKALYEAGEGGDSLRYFLASALFAGGAYVDARRYFDEVGTSRQTHYTDRAHWYLVLTALKLGEEQTIESLAVSVHEDSPYAERIRTIHQALQ